MGKTIALAGFMGCGKSSVGKELCSLAGASLTDLDLYIERRSGRKIPDIFAESGEKGFRALEKQCLEEVLETCLKTPGLHILSLGGGTLTIPSCAGLIRSETTCVYLRASVDLLVRNLSGSRIEDRPMLASPDDDIKKEGFNDEVLRKRICSLMSSRSHIYESVSHIAIDVDGLGFRQTAERIISLEGLQDYCC